MLRVWLCVWLVGWLTLAAVAQAEAPAFVRVADGGPPSAATASSQLGPDLRMELVDGVLSILAGDASEPVPCTHSDGAGRVHGFTHEPSGRVVVAAEHGLFVLDAQHPVLDAMDLYDGVPAGEPLAVYADDRDRIWVCTEQQFGVIDARFGFGRTFVRADGLPPPPYRTLDAVDGAIRLHTDDGVFAYRPDVGSPPRRNGGVERTKLVATADGKVPFSLSVDALGGATLRQRRRNHHLLQALPEQRLHGLRPGHHVLEVYAFDRDLRSELVAEYTVHVPLPKAFDTRWLPLGTFAFAGLLLVLAWPRRGRRRFWRAFARTGLLLVLSIQLLAALLGYGRSWPFVGFSMYTENYHEGSVLYQPRIRGLRADGSYVTLAGQQVGLLQDGYWQMLAEVLHGASEQRARLLQMINQRRGDEPRMVGIELADKRIRLTRQGPVDVAATVLVQWRQP